MIREEIYKKVSDGEITASEAMELIYKLESEFPLSANQKTLMFSQILYPNNTAYNLPIPILIHESVPKERIHKIANQLLKKHPSLRIHMKMAGKAGEEVIQVLSKETEASFLYEEFNMEEKTQDEVLEKLKECLKMPYDFEKDDFLRIFQLRLETSKSIVLLVVHHIIADGISLSLLARDFVRFYIADKEHLVLEKEKERGSYRQFINWQKKFISSDLGKKMQEYWIQTVLKDYEKIDLPRKNNGDEDYTFQGDTVIKVVDTELLESLRTFSKTHKVSLFVLTLAAFYILLYRYSGQNDLQIGSPAYGRQNADFAECVGYFSNIILLSTHIDDEKLFLDYVAELKAKVMKSLDYSVYPLPKIGESLGVVPTKLFSVAFALQAFIKDMEIDKDSELFGAKTKEEEQLVNNLQQEGAFELFLEIQEGKKEATLAFKYQSEVFAREVIERFADNYVALLKDILLSEDKKIYELDCVCKSEREFLLETVNNTTDTVPTECFQETFEKVARKNPEKLALIYKEQKMTYRELSNITTILSEFLIKKGIGPGDIIGVYVDRSIEWVVSMLSIFKAGAIYLPLDPKLPLERLKYIMEDTEMKYVFSDRKRKEIQNEVNATMLDTEAMIKEAKLPEKAFLPYSNPGSLTDVAYIIYTSGSTGTPKGVQVWHCGFANSVNTLTNRPGIQEGEHGISIATMCFDMSLVEITPVLYKGGCIDIVPSDIIADGIALARYLENCGGTFMSATPSTYAMLFAAGFENKSIRHVWVGGESLNSKVAEKMLAAFDEVTNIFGPTETSFMVSVQKITDSNKIEVGTPIGNHKMYVLDAHQQLLPIGAKGELYIGGKGVYKPCYYKNEENNQKKFVPDRFSDGEYLYKSGDLVSILPAGNLHFYCRLDGMVKFRGVRIELDEIDNAISKLKEIRNVASVIRKDGGDHVEICSFLLLNKEYSTVSVESIKTRIKEWLPLYMIPNRYILLQEMPLLINLKINKKYLTNESLPAILKEYQGKEATEEETSVEEITITKAQEIDEFVEEATDSTSILIALIVKDIRNLILEILAADDIEMAEENVKALTLFEKIGFDSVRFVKLAIAMNTLYDIDFNPSSFTYINNTKQLAIELISKYHDNIEQKYRESVAFKAKKVIRKKNSAKNDRSKEIAVIGFCNNFPGSNVDTTGFAKRDESLPDVLPQERAACVSLTGRKAYFLEKVWNFDSDTFELSSEDAISVEPQQRILVSMIHQMLEKTGYHELEKAGIYLSVSEKEYIRYCDTTGFEGNRRFMDSSNSAENVSKILSIKGICETFDGDKSSAESILKAWEAVANGQCEMAIAGGCNLYLDDSRIKMLEKDGRLNICDGKNDNGMIPAEGACVLLLKSLEDAIRDHDSIFMTIQKITEGMDASSEIVPSITSVRNVLNQSYEDIKPDKLSMLATLSFGTNYSEDIVTREHEKLIKDGCNTELINLRNKFGDLGGASIYASLAYLHHILRANENTSSEKKLYGLTETAKSGLTVHIVVSGYQKIKENPNWQDEVYQVPEMTIEPAEKKVIKRIQDNTPVILGVTNNTIPVDRMMKYWADAKHGIEPLPIGSTFLLNGLLEQSDKARMVHMLVTVPSTGKKIEAIIKGTGKPVLFVPGYGLTVTQFLMQIMAFSLDCQMICLHPPGVGLSEECNDVSFEAISDYYMEVLDSLGITEKVNVISTSWGGVLAQFIASRYKNKVNSMILSNTSSELVIDTHVGLREMLSKDFTNVDASEAEKMFDESTCIQESCAYKYERVLSTGKGKTAYFLDSIQIPTLVIAGGKDELLPMRDLEVLHQHLKNSSLEVVEESGHATNLTNPREFNLLCENFLVKQGVPKISIMEQWKQKKNLLKLTKKGD